MKKDVPQLLTSFKPGTGVKHCAIHLCCICKPINNPEVSYVTQLPKL